jgi:hypothetical protein
MGTGTVRRGSDDSPLLEIEISEVTIFCASHNLQLALIAICLRHLQKKLSIFLQVT